MIEVVADTGPLLHLSEIGQLTCLHVFSRIVLPDMVLAELSVYGVNLDQIGVAIVVSSVPNEDWQSLIGGTSLPVIHPADAQVMAVTAKQGFALPVLTDDLALRRRLESQGAMVIGSFGVLVRAYTRGYLGREALEGAVNALFEMSSLYTSSAFRAYARSLLLQLP